MAIQWSIQLSNILSGHIQSLLNTIVVNYSLLYILLHHLIYSMQYVLCYCCLLSAACPPPPRFILPPSPLACTFLFTTSSSTLLITYSNVLAFDSQHNIGIQQYVISLIIAVVDYPPMFQRFRCRYSLLRVHTQHTVQ